MILLQNSVSNYVQFWRGLDAHKFTKDLCGKMSTKFSKDSCGKMSTKFSKDSCAKFSTNFSEDSRPTFRSVRCQNLILTGLQQDNYKKDSVVLLVAKTLSIRGSLYIWYSLQITLRLRGATPTNRHPLQSCGFSREILWHSCLEVVMNLYFNGKVCWKQYMLIKFQNISFVGLFWNLRQSLTKSSLPINVASHECPF